MNGVPLGDSVVITISPNTQLEAATIWKRFQLDAAAAKLTIVYFFVMADS
ncbi:hypothetical protein ACFOLF_23110 [Paenibacillus sepulcri]|uniref:Uncharacterized protein n=1 Tax=Paenibacillus sepulcri TaxID=359917 RepID=A0ABS7C6T1_9BACL|nr:hypothetical protein [Paenibacillus sepulcri]